MTDAPRSEEWPYDTRIPILHELDDYSNPPDHVRGALYANQLLGTDLEKGDVVYLIYLDRVEPAFFDRVEEARGLDATEDPLYEEFKRNQDIIGVPSPDALPDEFTPVDSIPEVSDRQ